MPDQILVVDDDAAVRNAVAQTLLEGGYGVEGASGGNEALEAMRERAPDLVLLDLMMPEMSGWDVLAQMAEIPQLASVPVLVLTALDQRRDLPPGRHVLHKPIESELLLDVVRSVLEHEHDVPQ